MKRTTRKSAAVKTDTDEAVTTTTVATRRSGRLQRGGEPEEKVGDKRKRAQDEKEEKGKKRAKVVETTKEKEDIKVLSEIHKEKGSGPDQSNGIMTLSVDPITGHVFCSDFRNQRVQVLDPSGSFLSILHPLHPPSSPPSSYGSTFFAFPPSGDFVAALDTNQCMVFVLDRNKDFEVVKAWGGRGQTEGLMEDPFGIAFNPLTNHIIVCDTENSRLHAFTFDGERVRTWGKKGKREGMFDSPHGVCVDPRDGTIYISDFHNNRIQIYTKDFSFIKSFGKRGQGQGTFNGPTSVVLDPVEDRLFVNDSGNCMIQVFDLEGCFIQSFSLSVVETEQQKISFSMGHSNFRPSSISLNLALRHIWVSDWDNNALYILQRSSLSSSDSTSSSSSSDPPSSSLSTVATD